MDREAERVAHHHERVARGRLAQLFRDRAAGAEQSVAVAGGVVRRERQVQHERVLGGVIRDARTGVAVDLDEHLPGRVGDEVRARGVVVLADDAEAQVLAVPGGDGVGVLDLPRDMFDVQHAPQLTAASRLPKTRRPAAFATGLR